MNSRLIYYKASSLKTSCPRRPFTSRPTTASNEALISIQPASDNGDTRTYRPRKWGNRSLPLSPIMDPVRLKQRNRYKDTKLPAPKNAHLTPLQKALVNNPYARALATDVRYCKISETHLPSFFQIPFDVRTTPEPPHEPWLVPSKLYAEVSPKSIANTHDRGSSTYVQGRQSVLRFLTGTNSHQRLMSELQKQGLGGRKKVVWRKDTDEFILGLLQNAVVHSMRWGLQHPKAELVARCDEGAHGVGTIDGVACLLYVDTIRSHEQLAGDVNKLLVSCHDFSQEMTAIHSWTKKRFGKSDDSAIAFPPALHLAHSHPRTHFPMARYKDRKIPVYSLNDILGEDKALELLKDTAFEDVRGLVLKEGNLTTNTQLALLRLQEYLS